jgi:hypothetical protein
MNRLRPALGPADDRTLADTVDWPAVRQHDWIVYEAVGVGVRWTVVSRCRHKAAKLAACHRYFGSTTAGHDPAPGG